MWPRRPSLLVSISASSWGSCRLPHPGHRLGLRGAVRAEDVRPRRAGHAGLSRSAARSSGGRSDAGSRCRARTTSSAGWTTSELSLERTTRSSRPASTSRSIRSSMSSSSLVPIASSDTVTPRAASSRFSASVDSCAWAQTSRAGSKPSRSSVRSTCWAALAWGLCRTIAAPVSTAALAPARCTIVLVPGRSRLRRRQLDEAGSCIGVVDADGELTDEQVGELVLRGVAECGGPQRLVDPRRADDRDPARGGHVAEQADVPADPDARAVDEEVDPRRADLGEPLEAHAAHVVPLHPAVVGIGRTEEVDEQVLVRERGGEAVVADRAGHGLDGAVWVAHHSTAE